MAALLQPASVSHRRTGTLAFAFALSSCRLAAVAAVITRTGATTSAVIVADLGDASEACNTGTGTGTGTGT